MEIVSILKVSSLFIDATPTNPNSKQNQISLMKTKTKTLYEEKEKKSF